MGKKCLKIAIQNKINNNLLSAYYLSIILANENLVPWAYENYVQLFLIEDKQKKFDEYGGGEWLDFYGSWNMPSEILDITPLEKMLLKNVDIIEYLEEKIEKDYYIFTYIDEYYTKPSFHDKGKHLSHDILVYGYDKEIKEFYVLGFDDNMRYCSFKISYDIFKQAFKSGIAMNTFDDNYGASIKYKYNKDFKHIFNINKFNQMLGDYIFSKDSTRLMQIFNDFTAIYLNENKIYGMDVYEGINRYIERINASNGNIAYPLIHTLFEHKKSIYERLIYIDSNFNVDLKDIIQKYKSVVDCFNNIRFICIKYNKIKIASLLAEAKNMVANQKELEQKLLTEVYEKISKIC